MQFIMRLQQKHVKLCRGYKLLHPRLTKYCRVRVPGVPGGVDAYGRHQVQPSLPQPRRQTHFCTIHSIKSANLLNVSPACTRRPSTPDVGSVAIRHSSV